jgi:hypothetical protein
VLIEKIGLVEYADLRDPSRTDLSQDFFHGVLPGARLSRRDVRDVEQKVCLGHLLQGRVKRLDKQVGKAADETDRVGERGAETATQVQDSRGRIQRLERAIPAFYLRGREPVHECALSGVRVSDEGHAKDVRMEVALDFATTARARETAAEEGESLSDTSAVDFQLRLTGPTRTDAASGSGKVIPQASQAGEQVLKLSGLYLQLGLGRPGAPRKDVED